jgi:hypothetical protein
LKYRLGAAFAAVLAVAGCHNTDPTKIDFPDHTNRGLVLLQVEPASVPYSIVLVPYDEAKHEVTLARIGQPAIYIYIDPSTAPTYVARKMEPGTYAIQAVNTQKHWEVCFHDQTRSFAINTNEALFLGDFRPAQHLRQIESFAKADNQTTSRIADLYDYFDGIVPPQLTTPTTDSADFLLAKRYEAASMPMLLGRLKPVAYQPAHFATSDDFLGHRHCF